MKSYQENNAISFGLFFSFFFCCHVTSRGFKSHQFQNWHKEYEDICDTQWKGYKTKHFKIDSFNWLLFPFHMESSALQYLGYCMVCNSFNISHGLNLMLRKLTRHSSTLAIRVLQFLSYLFSFHFSSSAFPNLNFRRKKKLLLKIVNPWPNLRGL